MPLMLSEFHAAGYRSLVTHSERLAAAIAAQADVAPLTVIKRDGETWIEGLKITGEFRDEDDDP